jgi:hypothetical protein
MAIWGNNKKDQSDHGPITNDEGSRRSLEHDEPTERTRLLQDRPPPVRNDGYLNPDDPAVSLCPCRKGIKSIANHDQVSPYNLWTVRFLRYLTVLFLVITFLWWVLLLVSIFVSPYVSQPTCIVYF